MRVKSILGLAISLAMFGVSAEAAAATIEIDPSADLIATTNSLQPGDELVLQGGTYNLQSKFTIGVNGTAQSPIVIRAKDDETVVITRPDAGQNTINIEFSSHLILRGIEVTNGSHGIRMRESSFITIEDCHIHHTDDVAISANYPGSSYEGLQLLRNHIHDTSGTGEGMYLGCNNNGCQMFDSLIEGNYIHHTNGPGIQQGDGIEIKEGSYNNIVRDNVIHDTNYPCLITYGTVGNGGPNIIERNLMWGCGDHAIQSAADAIIRNNIILGAAQDGIRSQPHQGASPSNLTIVHNTIVQANNDAIRINGIDGEVTVVNNALYAQSGNAIRLGGSVGMATVSGNVGVGSVQNVTSGFDNSGDISADFIGANYINAVPNDVFPAPGSALIAAADPQYLADDDFNATARLGALDAGAYSYDAAGNPGWALGEDFKEIDDPGSSGAGGGGGSSAGAGGNGSGGNGSGNASAGGSSGTGEQGGSSGGIDELGDPSDAGCSCKLAAPSASDGWLASLLLAASLMFRRRRPKA